MKLQVSSLLVFLVLLGAPLSADSQGFPYHLYAPRTIAELAELSSATGEAQTIARTTFGISAKPFYSAVRLEYAGEVRDLSERKMGFYKLWASTLNVESSNTKVNILDVLQKEFLFKECDKEYWITVSTPAANDFPEDMKKGDRLTLYLMMAGGLRYGQEPWDSMFLANSFKIYE